MRTHAEIVHSAVYSLNNFEDFFYLSSEKTPQLPVEIAQAARKISGQFCYFSILTLG